MIRAAMLLVAVLALSACAPIQTPPAPPLPAELTVSAGFESIVGPAADLAGLAKKLDAVNANSVNISVGRLDWTAFHWDRHPEAEADPGRDHVADAIKALGTNASGQRRKVTLTIDLLVPRLISQQPGIAGINFDGSRSTNFASVTALSTGPIRTRLVDLVTDVTKRYHPNAVDLTELMFENNTYGGDDRDSYMAATGAKDWPRTANGNIDVNNPSIGAWRSEAIAGLVARATAAAHANGATLDMDVRASWTDPTLERQVNGHDYGLLAAAADRLVVWDYFGLNAKPAGYSADLARAMAARRGRFAISVGLWATQGTITPADLVAALDAAAAGGAQAVAVTPASLMTDQDWQALGKAWAQGGPS